MTDDQEKKQSLMANLERAIEIRGLAPKAASDKSGAPYQGVSRGQSWGQSFTYNLFCSLYLSDFGRRGSLFAKLM